jgi:ATP-dependent Lon protease
MKESAQAALSLIKGSASGLGLDPGMFAKSDIHIHVPAGVHRQQLTTTSPRNVSH